MCKIDLHPRTPATISQLEAGDAARLIVQFKTHRWQFLVSGNTLGCAKRMYAGLDTLV